jgi:hypothetical protein
MDYFDCDRVRFVGGLPQSIGGWTRLSDEALLGTPRSIFAWSTLAAMDLIGIGTHWKYYVYDGSDFTDITPIVDTEALGGNPLTAVNGSSEVTVNDVAHGASVDDFIIVSGATTFAGLSTDVLNAEHQIIEVVDADNYIIDVGADATSSASGGGASVQVEYLLASGQDSVILGAGWGAGSWGHDGGWGSAADSVVAGSQLRIWTEDNWGEDLLINPRGGAIYFRDTSGGGRGINLTSISGANEVPVVADQIIVSPEERTAIAFGCNPIGTSTADPLMVRWCDRENLPEWEPTDTTTAGGFRLTLGSKHMIAKKIKQGIATFTNKALYVIQFLGEDGYAPRLISSNTQILGPRAANTLNGVLYWMGVRGLFAYTGTVQELPAPLKDFIYNDINETQSWKCHVGVNPLFNEVKFFYCSRDSEEIDRYVLYNPGTGWWAPGTMERTAWLESGVYQRPRALSPDGYLYEHESGFNDGTTDTPVPLGSYIETNLFTFENGRQQLRLRWAWPDIDFLNSTATTPEVILSFRLQDKPGSEDALIEAGEIVRTVSFPIQEFTDKIDIGKRGRYIALRLECNQLDTAWRMGVNSLDVKQDGKR